MARGWTPTGWLTPVSASPGRKGPPSARAGPRWPGFGCLLGSARGHGTGPAFGRVQWSSSPDWIGNPPAAQDRGGGPGDAPQGIAPERGNGTGGRSKVLGPADPAGPGLSANLPLKKNCPQRGPYRPCGPWGPAAGGALSRWPAVCHRRVRTGSRCGLAQVPTSSARVRRAAGNAARRPQHPEIVPSAPWCDG